MNKFLLVLPLVAALTACGPQTESSTQIERRKQEELSLQAVQSCLLYTSPSPRD